MSDHIHDIGTHDGRGKRRFYVDGKRVDDVFYADTKRGIVDHYRRPLKVDKHKKRIIAERIRGQVDVVYELSGGSDYWTRPIDVQYLAP